MRTISHYEILEKLGEGGMGVVYRARDTRLGRIVAIKILRADLLARRDRRLRFIQEARTASALNHPNIVTFYDIDSSDGIDFIAMEYVPGKTLGAWIGRRGLTLSDVLKSSVQIAGAVAAAHAAGIIHRDLKPGNVMVTEDGVAKVVDFGLAKLVEPASASRSANDEDDADTEVMEEKPQTQEGQIVGTVAYMSPEQAEGKVVDARSDIFSFGTMLYEMLTGRRAFQRDSRSSTLSAIISDQPVAVSAIKPELPRDLETIINRCLRKDPNRRFQHMGDVKIALEELKEQSDSGTLMLGGRPDPAKLSPRWIWSAGLVALLVLSGLGAWMLWFRREPAPAAAAMYAVPITSYRGAVDQPSLSPDGNQVAFDWTGQTEDNFDIYIKLIGPGPPLRLTSDSAIDYSPAWSPDGRLIAFGRLLDRGKYGMYVIPALGGLERKLNEGFATGNPLLPGPYAAWSQDSKWIIAPYQNSPNVPYEMSLISAETGERRALIGPAAHSLGDTMPSLSPDGKTLAFCRTSISGTCDIFLLHLTGDLRPLGNLVQITSENHVLQGLDFTADGREIVFSSDRSGKYALWRMRASPGSTPQPLALGEDAINPQVSRRARRLVFVRRTIAGTIRRIPVSGSAKNIGEGEPFLSSSRDEQTPQYSPDGRRIAFASDRSGSWEIWLANADGSNTVQLTSFPVSAVAQNPVWSPSSDELAFQVFSFITNRYEIYRMPAKGGQPERLIDGLQPSWSRDGKWIYFVSGYPAFPQIWKISREGGQPIQVTKQGGAFPMESSDGKLLYYGKDMNCVSLRRISLADGEDKHVLDIPGEWSLYTLVGPDIYYIAGTLNRGQETPKASIESFRPSSGARKRVATIEKPLPYGRSEVSPLALNASPDGKFLFYTQQDRQVSELMLVDNFR